MTGNDAAAFDRMGAAAVLVKAQRELVGGLRERTLAVAVGNGLLARMLLATRRCTGGASGAIAARRSATAGSDSNAISTRCAASSAAGRLSATTTAIGSPT